MKNSYRRILGTLALGGGFLGFTMGIASVVGEGQTIFSRLLMAPFVVLYGWGIYCGLRMIEDPVGALRMNRTFWAVQIPCLISPIIGGYFFSGAYVLAAVSTQAPQWKVAARLGSEFHATLLQADKPYAAGVNLFAVAVVVLLTWELRSLRQPAGVPHHQPLPLAVPDAPALPGDSA